MVKGGGQTRRGSPECPEILQRPKRLFAEDIDEDAGRSEEVTELLRAESVRSGSAEAAAAGAGLEIAVGAT